MKILSMENISFSYGRNSIISNLSFAISDGETFGIIGPNGSGKTTLLRIISGSLADYRGEVLLKGRPLNKYSRKEIAKLIAFMEQTGTPLLSFTVEEVVAMGRYPWLKPFKGLEKKDYMLIEEALKNLDVWSLRKQPVYTLSGGERQLVSLARAMVQDPQVLFLDEPTTYLDIGHQLTVMKHIEQWQEDKNITVIMVLHDLNIAAQFCKRLALINKGKIQSIGTAQEVLRENNLEVVYRTKPILIEHPINHTPQILLQR